MIRQPTGQVSSRTNLPFQLTSFVGREREMAEVKRRLTTTRLLTLTGAGGSGKTRLALQSAHDLIDQYVDGVWFVELARLADPVLVPEAVAATLGIREQPGRPLTDTLLDILRPKDSLLILDNCEHLRPACAALSNTLLQACPGVRLLTTSQVALRVAGETTWLVPSLSMPDPQRLPAGGAALLTTLASFDAIRLFVERASAAVSSFQLTEQNAMAVAQICRRLDGIPLAIELAAARVKVLTVQQIAQRLADAFSLLTRGASTVLPRHQTLRAAVDWSYALLSEHERAALRRLSVFAGGFTLEAAEAVLGTEDRGVGDAYFMAVEDVLDLVADLVDKSLVEVVEREGAEEARYRLLETIRQYGAEKLDESGETEALQQSHTAYFLELAEVAEPKLKSYAQLTWLDRLEQEHDNFRAALTWCRNNEEVESGLRLAAALWRFWKIRGHLSEGRGWLETFLAGAPQRAPTRARARALCYSGALAWHQGDLDLACARLAEAVTYGRVLGDLVGLAIALHYLGLSQSRGGNLSVAHSYQAESLAVARQAGDAWATALALYGLGGDALMAGEYSVVDARCEESLAILRGLGDRWLVCNILIHAGEAARAQGDDTRAVTLYQQSLTLAQELGMKEIAAVCLHNLGWMAVHRRDSKRAAALFEQSLDLAWELGVKYCLAWSLGGLASVAGGTAQGAQLFGAAEAMREAFHILIDPIDQLDYDHAVATAREVRGDKEFAAAWSAGRGLTLDNAVALARHVAAEQGTEGAQAATEARSAVSAVPAPTTPIRAAKERYGSLTAREREVAALIAQGKTNDDITRALSVGIKTVETHISHIFTKLGFDNRAQVAAWAIDKGLAEAPRDLDDPRRHA